MKPRLRVIGPGRAGRSLAGALQAAGWQVVGLLGRDDELDDALVGTDLLVLAVPDRQLGAVAAQVRPARDGEPSAPARPTPDGDAQSVIAHLAGSYGLDVLAPHRRVAALHPLVSLPSAEVGAARLRAGQSFGVAGDPIVRRVVEDLGGRWFEVADRDRAAYHAAAAVASNHLVALLGQVERITATIGVPADAYMALAAESVANVAELGAAAALTGPVVRGDWDTVARHLAALDETERATYRAVAAAARRLVDGGDLPPGL